MKNITTKSEFKNLAEEEILKALDEFESLFEDELDEDTFENVEPEDPIVIEVSRLINEYANRFDQYCEDANDIPEDIFDYEPEVVIERIAYEIFLDAVHDAMQEEDDE